MNMSVELKLVRESELEAWERCAQQYQYSYAFIRLGEAGEERAWINSFGELALERQAEHRALFVFFSDLEISIVTKILDQNVRAMSKDAAALEVIVGAWFRSAEDKLEHLVLGSEASTVEVESVPVQKSQMESDFFNTTTQSESVEYRALYETTLKQFSHALRAAATESETVEAAENVYACIQAMLNVAAQHGFLKLFLYLQDALGVASEALGENEQFDYNVIEKLRDFLTYTKALVSAALTEGGETHVSLDSQVLFSTQSTVSSAEEFRHSSVETQRSFEKRLARLAGYLRIDVQSFKDFGKDNALSERGDDAAERFEATFARLERHTNELQSLMSDFYSVNLNDLLSQSANGTVFSRATALLPFCCEIEGDRVCVPSIAVQPLQKCIDFLIQFLNRLPDSFKFAHLIEEPLRFSLRRSAVDFSISVAHSNGSEHWQMFARLLREHLKHESSDSRLVLIGQPSSGLLLKFPVDLSISQNLLVESAGECVALSVRTLVETGRVDLQRVQKIGSKRFVPFRDGVIPLHSLSQALSFNSSRKSNALRDFAEHEKFVSQSKWLDFVIAKVSNELIAFEVDEVFGQREMVVRDLNKIIPRFSGLLGVSVLDNERVSLVVDVAQLLTSDELRRGEYARKAS